MQRPAAPDLVLDLLMAYTDTLSAADICRAGALLGIRDATMRVALTRLLDEKKIQRVQRGLYGLDPAGLSLAQALADWQSERVPTAPWTGDWLGVFDGDIARADKTLWRRHQRALALRGFAPLRTGLQVRPNNRPGGLAGERQTLLQLGLAPQALVLRIAELDGLAPGQTRALWKTTNLDEGYRQLRCALTEHLKGLHRLPLSQALRESLLLGRAAVMHLNRDPQLPPELLSPKSKLALVQATENYKAATRELWRSWLQRPDET